MKLSWSRKRQLKIIIGKLAYYGFLFLNWFWLPVCLYFKMYDFTFLFLSIILIHEFGHYVIAKIDGNYKDFGFFPMPHINIEGSIKNLESPMVLLSGILFSFLIYPLMYILQIKIFSISYFIGLCITAGCMDLLQVAYWYYKKYQIGW